MLKNTLLTLSLLAAGSAQAFDKSQFIGRWKLESIKCASGKSVHFADENIVKFSLTEMVLSVYDHERMDARINYSYSFNDSYIKSERKKLLDAINDVKKMEQTKDVKKSLADLRKSLAEFDKLVQPQSCSNIGRMNYYIRGNTLYTNDLNNLSTCANQDGDTSEDDIDLEASTLDIIGNRLILTQGQEVQKDSTCPVGDRVVYTLTRD